MLSSAIASSSPVLMPARTLPRSSSSVWPTTRPALRIRSICWGVLISTPRSRRPMTSSGLRSLVQRLEDALGDVGDLAHAVDLDDEATLLVDGDQRLGLLEVDLLAPPDDVLGVVGAT